MTKALTNPLQAAVKRAAAALPASTGKVAHQQARLDRRAGGVVILADVSHSMNAPAWGALRKIDVLRDAVAGAMTRNPQCRLIVFSETAREVSAIPEPEANTDLVAGLEAARAHDPGVLLLISDGQPDDPRGALRVAESWRGAIDVLYVGPDTDAAAIDFMRRLARSAGGDMRTNDIGSSAGAKQLAQSVAGMLPSPRTCGA